MQEAIRFSIADSSFGSVLVAESDKGVCAVLINRARQALGIELQKHFPRALLQKKKPASTSWVAKVLSVIENPARTIDIPLDIRGTLFQQQVWKSLREIPAGSTASYADIARKLNKPKAMRAIAGACAANLIAILIPCHRVIRSDGSLSGYRWGAACKKKLLQREEHIFSSLEKSEHA